ncbi:MAG: GNAT family N-acetyltransferase [Dehalococcoidia bacterium]
MITDRVEVRALTRREIDALQITMPSIERMIDGIRTHSHAGRFRIQEEGAGDYLIAWVDGQPAGHVLVRWAGASDPRLHERIGRDPYVEGLAVRTDLQSRGVGTAIMLEAERRTVARGHTTIGLAVGVENARARRLYRRLGYRESGFGEFEVTWTTVDAAGNEGIEGESCTYLVKAL